MDAAAMCRVELELVDGSAERSFAHSGIAVAAAIHPALVSVSASLLGEFPSDVSKSNELFRS
jgi:hypothetical protein